jgi:hypothetical protein
LLMLAQAQVLLERDPTGTLQTAGAIVRKLEDWQEFTLVEARWQLRLEPERAVMLLRSLLERNPDSDDAHLLLVEALCLAGNETEARLMLRPVAKHVRGVCLGLEMVLGLRLADWSLVRDQLEEEGQWVWMTHLPTWRATESA